MDEATRAAEDAAWQAYSLRTDDGPVTEGSCFKAGFLAGVEHGRAELEPEMARMSRLLDSCDTCDGACTALEAKLHNLLAAARAYVESEHRDIQFLSSTLDGERPPEYSWPNGWKPCAAVEEADGEG